MVERRKERDRGEKQRERVRRGEIEQKVRGGEIRNLWRVDRGEAQSSGETQGRQIERCKAKKNRVWESEERHRRRERQMRNGYEWETEGKKHKKRDRKGDI